MWVAMLGQRHSSNDQYMKKPRGIYTIVNWWCKTTTDTSILIESLHFKDISDENFCQYERKWEYWRKMCNFWKVITFMKGLIDNNHFQVKEYYWTIWDTFLYSIHGSCKPNTFDQGGCEDSNGLLNYCTNSQPTRKCLQLHYPGLSRSFQRIFLNRTLFQFT